MLTAERLLEVLDYEETTGLFRWKIRTSPRCNKGWFAGNQSKSGHLTISIDNKSYYCHRLAFLWMTGRWPKRLTDHKDLNPGNNKWDNLREANSAQNKHNQVCRKDSTSGLKGAMYNRLRGTWAARIRINGKITCLGTYSTPEEAHSAYSAAAKKYFGEFAR